MELDLRSRLEANDAVFKEGQDSAGLSEDENVSLKIGVVNMQRVIEESNKGIEARKYFEGLFSLRSEEELGNVEMNLINEIIKDIEIIVKEYAEKEGFTYIKDKLESGVIYNDESFDVTDEIIELYNRKVKIAEPGKTN